MTTTVTKTVKSAGGDYSSLSNWESGQQADITAATGNDTIQVAECYSMQDTTAVSIDGWTTAAANYISIIVAAGNQHSGVWDTNKYYLNINNSTAISINEDYVRISGIQVTVHDPSASVRDLISSTNSVGTSIMHFSNILGKGHGHATYNQKFIKIQDSSITAYIWNCIAYGFNPAVAFDDLISINASTAVSIYSCTLINGRTGISRGAGAGTVVAKNCYCGYEAGGSNQYNGTITKTTCASSDTTGNAGLQNIAVNATQFVDISAGTEDYHLAGVGSALYNVGTDTSGDGAPLNFTTDIDGETRSGTWDVGADEYYPPPTTVPPTTIAPTSLPPTTSIPTTVAPTTLEPPTTSPPTTSPPTTLAPTTLPSTAPLTTVAPTTAPCLYYQTDFSEYVTGNAPADWTEHWDTTFGTPTVQEVSPSYGGKVLRIAYVFSLGNYALSWDDVGNVTNVEVLVRTKALTDVDRICRIYLRGSGGIEEAYFADIKPSTDTIGIYKYVGGAYSTISESAKTIDPDTWYWMRFRVIDDDLKLRVWSGSPDDEPVAWNIETSDASIAGAGWVGVGGRPPSTPITAYYDWFSVATNGCTAEKPETTATTIAPTTVAPTTLAPTPAPTTLASTAPPTTLAPTPAPTTLAPTAPPTSAPTTLAPTPAPTTLAPTLPPTSAPTTLAPTAPPTLPPTLAPTTLAPTVSPTTVFLTSVAPTTAPPYFICEKPVISPITDYLYLHSHMANIMPLISQIAKEIKLDGDLCW